MAHGSEHDHRFRTAFLASPVGIGLSDENGALIAVNAALCALFGRSETELLGKSTAGFTHPQDLRTNHDAEALLREAVLNHDGVVRLQKRYLRPDGEVRWASLTVTMTLGPRGQPWTVSHIEDVTERRVADQALRESEANLAAAARVVRRLQTGTDPRQTILDAVLEVAGAGSAALYEPGGAGLTVTAVAGVDALGTATPVDGGSPAAQAFRTGSPVVVEDPAAVAEQHGLPLPRGGARSAICEPIWGPRGVIAVLTVTWHEPLPGREHRAARAVHRLADEAGVALEHDRMVRELTRSAVTDPLTSVANRRGWDTRLAQMLTTARRTGQPLTVAVLDLDRFKAYNDTHGHLAGDDLLRALARATTSVLRDVDLVARWGGDEFAIALPDCSQEDATGLLERVRTAVPCGQRCSIGSAAWDGSELPEQLLARADSALYRAKDAGRDTVRGA